MNIYKKLASQTAVYGLSSIVGRLLNYLLVPIYTRVFLPNEYGIVIELYAYIVVLQILLTYGMETGFFRFSEKNYKADTVFSTAFLSLFSTASLFVIITFIFAPRIASSLSYSEQISFIKIFALILGIDVLTALPFARLRQMNKAKKFAIFKIVNISINIGLNLFFILLCPKIIQSNPNSIINTFYNESFGVGYVFLSNLIASAVVLLLFIPDFFKIKYKFNFSLLKLMLIYSLPLLLTGLTGAFNEVADRILLKFWTVVPPDIVGVEESREYIMAQIGIYGANAKIAVLMLMVVQAFRYAAEPFFFSYVKKNDANKVFANIMKYFIILALFMFLGVMLYLDIVKHIIDTSYHEGLGVILPLFLSRIFVGIFFILSFWYKLKDVTKYGIVIFLVGAALTIGLNYILIPRYGYLGSAWTNFTVYLVMIIISYIWSRKYMPIKYNFIKIFGYFALAIALYLVSIQFNYEHLYVKLLVNTIFLFIFVAVIGYFENIFKLIKRLKKQFYERQNSKQIKE